MNGTIVEVNHQRGMFIVKVDDRAFSVFELLAWIDIEVGDRVSGKLYAVGGQELFHLGQGRGFNVYGQSGECALKAARGLIA